MDRVGLPVPMGHRIDPTDLAPFGTRVPIPELLIATIDVAPLLHDIVRSVSRPGEQTHLSEGLKHGYVRVFTTDDVVRAVDRRLPGHAAKRGIDAQSATALWERDYLPRLSIVEVADLFPTLFQHPDVALVCERDQTDVPLAALTALLGVRTWSEDKDFEALGTGRGVWLQHCLATIDAGKIDVIGVVSGTVTVESLRAGATKVASAYRWSESRIGRPATIGAAVALALLVLWALRDPARRAWVAETPVARGVAGVANAGLSTMVTFQRQREEARAFLANYASSDPTPPSAEMKLARVLARARAPMTIAQLSKATFVGENVVSILTRDHLAFVERTSGQWQLGRQQIRHQTPQVQAVASPRLIATVPVAPHQTFTPPVYFPNR
jgi:hypothetical protein